MPSAATIPNRFERTPLTPAQVGQLVIYLNRNTELWTVAQVASVTERGWIEEIAHLDAPDEVLHLVDLVTPSDDTTWFVLNARMNVEALRDHGTLRFASLKTAKRYLRDFWQDGEEA
ncbi:MAG: hypothetical protein AAGN64_17845 [Bacteroidota bacterium]